MSKTLSRFALATIVALTCAAQAHAQEGMKVAAEILFAIPNGKAGDSNHLDGKTGYGVGILFPSSFGNGHVFRPKTDLIVFNRETLGITQKATIISVVMDYNYFFSGTQNKDGYLIAGLGYNNTRREISVNTYGLRGSVSATTNGLAYNFGFGYAFNKSFFMEAKYYGADLPDFKANGYTFDTSYTANAVVLSAGFNF